MSFDEMYDESAGWSFVPWRHSAEYDASLEVAPDVEAPDPEEVPSVVPEPRAPNS